MSVLAAERLFMLDFKHSTIYQIYLKSFQDSNGDGIGDLSGIIQRLPYLKELGVEYLWLTPFFTSPQNDNGYDVMDYCAIDSLYGTMQDFETLVNLANEYGIGIILDMVFNHTSRQHEWFQKALAGDQYYKDYYIWKDPKPDGSLPTNWISKFGGSAWEYIPRYNQYYLHLFDKTQVDLNWKNPNVRHEMREILRFWMKKGVKGFRFDVVNLISKPEKYEDDNEGDGRRFYTDGPKIHEYLQELCIEVNRAGLITVGEMSSTSMEHCVRYSNPDERELSMCFNFHHLKVDYKDQQKWALMAPDFMQLKRLLNEWQLGMQEGNGWNALFWSNHDQPRILSRFGNDKEYHSQSAKMLATLMYLMRGTPYIFQGEEIGMTNAYFEEISQYADVESINFYHILLDQGKDKSEILNILKERSRDNSRTPMQWDSGQNAGFTSNVPWLSVNPNHRYINVDSMINKPDSIFSWYKQLIKLRRQSDVVALGSYTPMLEENCSLFAYRRDYDGQSLIVAANFTAKKVPLELSIDDNTKLKCLIGNYGSCEYTPQMALRPYEALVYKAVEVR